MNTIKLLSVLALVLVAGAFSGCKYFRGQIVDGPGMEREVDSLETDSVPWLMTESIRLTISVSVLMGCMPVIRTRNTMSRDSD